jgi:hypothetical protein
VAAATWAAAVIKLLQLKRQFPLMSEHHEGSEPALTGEQVGALLSYFGIGFSDDLQSLQEGVEALAQMQGF